MTHLGFTSRLTLVLPLFLTAASIRADEGMWTLDNFPADKVADKYGVIVDRDGLGDLQRATARLEGGCTGSFASPDGLVLTNHHCIQRCLTTNSSAESDLRANGFVASNREAELSCGGDQVAVLIETENVTDKVAKAIEDLESEEANRVRKSTLTALESACRDAAPATINQCEAVTLYNGGQYFLYKYKRYDDVRLAFAPEAAIAAFGGDPDNFNFPRWCLDMALLRVYEDGQPAQSPAFLNWRRQGVAAGDFVMVTGHPGSTQRLRSMAYLEYLRGTDLPTKIELNAERRGRLIQFAKTSDEARRVVQGLRQGVENGLKVRRNQQRALLDSRVFDARRQAEAVLRDAVAESESLNAQYGGAWQEIEQAINEYRSFYPRFQLVENGYGFDGVLYGYASSLVRAAIEREKPPAERLREYTGTTLERLRLRLLAERPISPELEELRLSFSLDKLLEILGPDDYFSKLVLGRDSPDALAAELIAKTTLADPAVREELWNGGMSAVESSKDPMIRLALAVEPEARDLRKRYDDQVEAPIKSAEEKIAAARFAILGTGTYPDATFTLRASYGEVVGWNELGEEITPFTTLGELYPRVREAAPFALPKSWQDLKLDPETRFNLATTNDIIGGNSGSPMTNADGELIGLVFDGNIHSIAGSYFYDGAKNRTVAVHAAIMLAALEQVYDAKHLAAEITTAKK